MVGSGGGRGFPSLFDAGRSLVHLRERFDVCRVSAGGLVYLAAQNTNSVRDRTAGDRVLDTGAGDGRKGSL